jgi:hypothetical protein
MAGFYAIYFLNLIVYLNFFKPISFKMIYKVIYLLIKFKFLLSEKVEQQKETLKFNYRKGKYKDMCNFFDSIDWIKCFENE